MRKVKYYNYCKDRAPLRLLPLVVLVTLNFQRRPHRAARIDTQAQGSSGPTELDTVRLASHQAPLAYCCGRSRGISGLWASGGPGPAVPNGLPDLVPQGNWPSSGYKPGNNLVRQMKQKDEIRIRQAENAIEELEKKCRQRAKLTKLRLEELLEEEEDPDNPAYAPGHY
ncbi:hypothetical protein J6590_016824 [Homalodisca vitripennis]|nr:hypothetical protein J6590_016824 [Homalodisca vitripennis]